MYKRPQKCTKFGCALFVIFATKLCIFCIFCDTIARILWFSHSSFSVAAVATHEQFKELNLQHSREVFIYFGKTQTLICIIQYIQRDIYFNKITNFGFFCSSFSNFFCWVITAFLISVKELQDPWWRISSLKDSATFGIHNTSQKKDGFLNPRWFECLEIPATMVLSWLVLNLYPLYFFSWWNPMYINVQLQKCTNSVQNLYISVK